MRVVTMTLMWQLVAHLARSAVSTDTFAVHLLLLAIAEISADRTL